MITCLAGGVGAARFLAGLIRVVPASDVTAVVNTGDDTVLHGLHISPDLDTVTYTLAGAINREMGWGLEGESWAAMEALERYGGETWFRLGDKDLATHLYRTHRLGTGGCLSEITTEIARAWGLDIALVPMSDDRVATRVKPVGRDSIGFQEWFVGERHSTAVEAIAFDGIEEAEPAPGVLDALTTADTVIICPSNPIVSIGPILGLAAVGEALRSRRDSVVAVSPIIAGKALKGPAATLMADLGHDPSVVGVARIYRDLAGTLVVDEADAGLSDSVEAEGMRCVVTPTVMEGADSAAGLASRVLGSLQ